MKKSVRIFWRIFKIGVLAFVLLIVLTYFGALGKMPSLRELENPTVMQSSEVYAIDGTLMGKYYRENGNRTMAKYRDISKYVIDGLVATEDKRFYEHSGIDLKGTLRAVSSLGSKGGASTITQQLALALFNQRSKNTVKRVIQKIKEWIISIRLEKRFTKEEILTLYLNAVPFSENVFGIRNASKTFFQKEPDRLNVEEAALLIGMINGPGIYNPRRYPKSALDRRNLVITRMAESNSITPAEAIRLKALPIKLNFKKADENTGYAPYFREILKGEIKEMLKDLKKPNGDKYDIYDDGLKIYTTINPFMQQYAEEAAAQHMTVLQQTINARSSMKNGKVWKDQEVILVRAMKESDRWKNLAEDGYTDKQIKASFHVKVPMKIFAWNSKREKDTVMTPMDSIKYHHQIEQASFMAMDPITGEVKAWVGGINFKTFKFDHVNINTKRQVGSTIKPFLYTQAVEERGFNAGTICDNVTQKFPGNALVPATKPCPGGTVTMANALAYSKNCATAYIMKQVGPQQFVDFLYNRLNIPTRLTAYPSLALGTCDLSMFEMLWGYTIFAGRGYSTKPYFINRIEDRNGNILKRFDLGLNRKEAISEVTAYKMVKMMQGTVDQGTARELRSRLGVAEMGGKTGTTDDNTDAWFIGYTPQLLVGSWVGFDDPFIRNEGEGNAIARPICEFFFKKVLADKKLGIDKDAKFLKPADLDNDFSADPMISPTDPNPAGEGSDQGVGTEDDYNIIDTIGPESKPVTEEDDEEKPIKKDTLQNVATKKEEVELKPIGSPVEEPKKKKGILNKLFGKKDSI